VPLLACLAVFSVGHARSLSLLARDLGCSQTPKAANSKAQAEGLGTHDTRTHDTSPRHEHEAQRAVTRESVRLGINPTRNVHHTRCRGARVRAVIPPEKFAYGGVLPGCECTLSPGRRWTD